MSIFLTSIQNWFDGLFALSSQRRLNNVHHFVCCGAVHVKFATFIIILIKLTITGFLSLYVLSNGVVVNHWLDVVYDVIELLTIVALIIGFIKEKSRWMWPYMAVQFTWLVIALIVYSICVSTIIFPQNSWISSTKSQTNTEIRIYALKTSFTTLIYSAGLGIELSILLACNRYFDDQRYRIHETRNRPIIRNFDNGQINQIVVDMDSIEFKNVLEKTKNQTENLEGNENNQNSGFSNPNFTLVDSEDDDENNWHKKTKKSNILA